MSFSLHQYGITLRRIDENDIELIRRHRNEPRIRKLMRYQKRISKRRQRKWFRSINNKFNYYFMIEVQGKNIGLINCKDVDMTQEIGEGGIFIWEDSFQNTPYPLIASVILIDFIFNRIEIGKSSVVRVLSSNKKAITYNKFLGYKESKSLDEHNAISLTLQKEIFNKKLPVLSKACSNYTSMNDVFRISGKPDTCNLEKINDFIKQSQNTLV